MDWGSFLGSSSALLCPLEPGNRCNHLYEVRKDATGPVIGFADVDDSRLILHNGEENEQLVLATFGGGQQYAYDLLLGLHIVPARGVSEWDEKHFSRFVSEAAGVPVEVASAKELLSLSDGELKRLGLGSSARSIVRQKVNDEMAKEASRREVKKEAERQSLFVPNRLPDENKEIGKAGIDIGRMHRAISRCAATHAIRLNDEELAKCPEESILLGAFLKVAATHSYLSVSKTLNLQAVVLAFEEASIRNNTLDDDVNRPAPPVQSVSLTTAQLTEMVMMQEKRIDQLEKIVASLVAQNVHLQQQKKQKN